MVYAFRYGKVIIVSPMINALAPVITIVLSLRSTASSPTASWWRAWRSPPSRST